MSRYFTGVALEVWPGSEFQSETLQTRISLRSLINSIYGIKRTLAKIFCLSVVIEAINLLMPVGTQLVMDHAIPAGDRGLLTLNFCCSDVFYITQSCNEYAARMVFTGL
ncbi:Colicin V secretion/processing ATP-binding protein CvaB [Escherichia coli]|nr:Colicin V secretion/processing ATP-binding protein CvaB [Escherichia coli]